MKFQDRQVNASSIIDSLVVLINLAAVGTLLLYVVLPFSKATWIYGITILVDMVYLFFKGKDMAGKYVRIPGVLIFNGLLFYNFLNSSLRGEVDFVTSIEYILISIFFSLILTSLATKITRTESSLEKKVAYLSKGYIWLSLFSIVGVIITFILLSAGFDTGFQIDSPLLVDNEENGASYLWTFFSARIEIQNILQIRVPFFQDYGILTGIFHEPHILAYNIFPCLIMLLGLTNGKLTHTVIVITAILFILFCGSTTNLISAAATLAVFAIFSFRKHPFAISVSIALLVYAIIYYIAYDDTLFQFVLGRLDESNASNEASRGLLKFAFTPKTFFGTNMFSSEMMYGSQFDEDVGLIPFFMNIAFLFFYIRNVVKLIFIKDGTAKAVGYACLYYIIHSAKMGMLMYKGLMPLLLVFLQFIVLDYYGRVRTVRKIISKGEGTPT